MPRLTESTITPAERKALKRLHEVLGFSPKVLFGRDRGNDFFFRRLLDPGTSLVYALAVNGNGQKAKKGVREFRLLVAPVKVGATKNGTHESASRSRGTPRIRNRKAWRE